MTDKVIKGFRRISGLTSYGTETDRLNFEHTHLAHQKVPGFITLDVSVPDPSTADDLITRVRRWMDFAIVGDCGRCSFVHVTYSISLPRLETVITECYDVCECDNGRAGPVMAMTRMPTAHVWREMRAIPTVA